MESSADKNWAANYLLGPLSEAEPSQKDGPGNHYRSSINSKSPAITTYPTPPASASPTQSAFHPSNPYASSSFSSSSHRQEAFGEGHKEHSSRRQSGDRKSVSPSVPAGHRRRSSLNERYPGDMSHRPLDQIKKETKSADRAPHLKKKHLPGADIIDQLDASTFGVPYHHEGPYDATLMSRNTNAKTSPLAAVKDSNDEALKATPRENIQDSLRRHVPLQGTAVIPPGDLSYDGRTMQYEEGADLMREEDAPGGAYKRYDFIQYHADDLKGKGEPSFTIDRALKDQTARLKAHRRNISDGNPGYEMQTGLRPPTNRQRSHSQGNVQPQAARAQASGNALKYSDFEGGINRSSSTGRKITEGLKSRFGSLRKSRKASIEA